MNTATIIPHQIKLSDLLVKYLNLPEKFDVELTGIELDSRRVGNGDLFLACKGAIYDGRDFVDEVIASGASAVLVEASSNWSEITFRSGIPIIPIDKLICRIGKLAARFFSYPATAFWLIGVTGTNGKTSCCEFISQCLFTLGYKCGVSGTLGIGMYGDPYNSLESMPPESKNVSATIIPVTTPDAVTLQRVFEDIRVQQADVMTMEVSSHGLQQKRVNLNEFDVAVFTNLSRDHLDYHGSMQAYGDAKRKLFSNPFLKIAVVNFDDIFSASILNSLSRNVKSFTYSLHNPKADVFPRVLKFTRGGFSLELVSPWGEGKLTSSLMGSFNVSNLLATLTSVMATEATKAEFSFDKVLAAISEVMPVKGRMELIGNYSVSVVVDYAHTPDGLKNALQALRMHFSGRVWCVFGCGGNRDKGKRPLMAEVVEELADELIVTDDNPRQEASKAIIEQILRGFSDKAKVLIESDRVKAIEHAIANAELGDVVLIAGKGHEEYQDIGGKRMMFSDVKQARFFLNKRFA